MKMFTDKRTDRWMDRRQTDARLIAISPGDKKIRKKYFFFFFLFLGGGGGGGGEVIEKRGGNGAE